MFSALVIRDLAATIESLHQPQLASRPLIVVSGNGHLKVLASDAWARQAGYRPVTAASRPSFSVRMRLSSMRGRRFIAGSSTR